MKLRSCLILLTVTVLLPYLAKAQFVSERTAMNNIEKGKWEKARNQLFKVMQKDSLNTGAEYALSVYFFSSRNPDFQIDSAYAHAKLALEHFQQASSKQRERYLKIPLDSNILVDHRERIDSAAFTRAKSIHTETAYIDFLKHFPLALQRKEAEVLRDEVAYQNTEKENSYPAFLLYLQKYPASKFAPDAKARYERLILESKTADKKLASYESFLSQYPLTSHRREVEEQIFQKATASGETQSFERFLKKYSESWKALQAKNILYHLLKEDERALMPALMNDSIRKVQSLEKFYLVPFLKDDKFGFMNERGEEIIKASLKAIPDEYLCGNITEELIILEDKIIARNGAIVYRGKTDDVKTLGYGFLKITHNHCVTVLHVSGFVATPDECLQDAMLIAKKYLALKKGNRWSVFTLSGRKLTPFEWDDIQQLNEVVAFKKEGRIRLIRLKEISKFADEAAVLFSKEYDEVKLWSSGMLWTRSGNEQSVLNQILNEWIPAARQEITPYFFGAVSQTSAGYVLYDKNPGPSPRYYGVKVQQPWITVELDGAWSIVDPATKKAQGQLFDSVNFVGPFFMGIRKDSVQIHITKTSRVEARVSVKAQFIPGRDSLFFLMLEEGVKKTLYNAKAERLFTINADKVEYNNEGFFTITQKKKGLISLNGKVVLQPEYDALGTVENGRVATLKDKRFGLVDLLERKIIKPEYDKNIVVYNHAKLVACKGNLYALIGLDNRPVTPFEYEEIRYWNDSTALVKKNFQWIMYNFIEKKVIMDRIKGYKLVQNTEAEKIMIAQQDNKYGVISNRRGTIIPATFSDIVNVGSATQPLYFTEKQVEEASVFIVIYYDRNGVQLKKFVYEAEDYEKIYCSGN